MTARRSTPYAFIIASHTWFEIHSLDQRNNERRKKTLQIHWTDEPRGARKTHHFPKLSVRKFALFLWWFACGVGGRVATSAATPRRLNMWTQSFAQGLYRMRFIYIYIYIFYLFGFNCIATAHFCRSGVVCLRLRLIPMRSALLAF